MAEIIPAIIADSSEDLQKKIRLVEPYVQRVQIDIMDGIFVSTQSKIGPSDVAKIETPLAVEIHLMVSKPENHIARWLDTQADKIIVHWEATDKFQECINLIKDEDKLFGVALNSETAHQDLANFMDQIDFIQFMTVEPGSYGGKFIDDVLDHVSDFHYFYPDIPIQVDGGINDDTAEEAVKAGVQGLVVGSYIYGSKDIKEAINNLKAIQN